MLEGDVGVTIESPLLRLVPLTVADAPELAQVLADPAIYRFIGGQPPTLPELRARFERLQVGGPPGGGEHWFNWVVRLKTEGDRAIGRVEATHFVTQDIVSVAWIIGPPWQGRGHASEAVAAMVEWLKRLKVGIIQAFIHPGHVASEGVARRVGFTVTDQVEDGERRWILYV